jgi:hypothetical protein
MQWEPVWRLSRPLGGHFPVTAGEGPRHSHDKVPGALSMHVAPPAIRIIVVPTEVIVLLGLHNPPHTWTSMVGPFLPGFTISPCVDSICAIGLIRWPMSILQDSPEVYVTYMHFAYLHISCLSLT